MRREVDSGLELDDDRGRVDVAAVHRYLAEESYWARGRAYADVEALVNEAARVVGLYDGDRQIGFCRAARCAPGLFYLADVYVLEAYRGHGLGVELVREMVEAGPLADAAAAGLGDRAFREALSVVTSSYEEHGGFRLRTLSA